MKTCFLCGAESDRATCDACLAEEADIASAGRVAEPASVQAAAALDRAFDCGAGPGAATCDVAGRAEAREDRQSAAAADVAALTPRERRICRRLAARGLAGLGEELCRLDGALVGGRFGVESLLAVGTECAVYMARDLTTPGAPRCIAKTALPPADPSDSCAADDLLRRHDALRAEAAHLAEAADARLPRSFGLHTLILADDGAGPARTEDTPVLVMEHLPGFGLERWLARIHGTRVAKPVFRRRLDEIAVVLLTALTDLAAKGFHYADLRPGKLRVHGRTAAGIRLLDAAGLVRAGDRSGRFPHVAAYLPPELFRASRAGDAIVPSAHVQAVMAGRTLYEVATGRVPLPGEPVAPAILYGENVSPPVAETIDRLCRGAFPDVAEALAFLGRRFAPPAAAPRTLFAAVPALAAAHGVASAPARDIPGPVTAGSLTAEVLAPIDDTVPVAAGPHPDADSGTPASDDDLIVDLPPPAEFLCAANGPALRDFPSRPAPRPAPTRAHAFADVPLLLAPSIRPGGPRLAPAAPLDPAADAALNPALREPLGSPLDTAV